MTYSTDHDACTCGHLRIRHQPDWYGPQECNVSGCGCPLYIHERLVTQGKARVLEECPNCLALRDASERMIDFYTLDVRAFVDKWGPIDKKDVHDAVRRVLSRPHP